MIGSACAAVVSVATSTTANAIGVGGIPGILSIQPQYMLSFAICMVIAIAVPFVLTMIVGSRKLSKADRVDVADTTAENTTNTEKVTEEKTTASETTEAEKATEGGMKAFLTGNVIPLKEVGDGVFSEGIMGEGFAIQPESDTLLAPVDAEVTVLMEDSRHAVGLTMANGMEILLHIGIDTVDMQGDGFTYLVSQGQKVKTGDPLIRFDRAKIKAAGHPDVTVCVITETGDADAMKFKTGIHAEAGKTEVAC